MRNYLKMMKLELPIQIKGKLISTIKTKKGYKEDDLLKEIYKIEKIKNKIDKKRFKESLMFKIKLLILLLISIVLFSCTKIIK